MTRINCVPVQELTRQHLVAEYRELPRIFGLVRKAQDKGVEVKIPQEYVLGTGHVRFFYNKLLYLNKRQKELIDEMIFRGYSPKHLNTEELLIGLDEKWLNDWRPDEKAMEINRARILERMPK